MHVCMLLLVCYSQRCLGAAVFHAGPSSTMFWFSTFGTTGSSGATSVAGTRPGGNIANGNSVMFDAGKILNCGGSEAFALEAYPATDFATLITITTPNQPAQVKTLSPMAVPRVYANGVVLPDGKVFINGGASLPKEFSDEYAYYQPGAANSYFLWCIAAATHSCFYPLRDLYHTRESLRSKESCRPCACSSCSAIRVAVFVETQDTPSRF